jgi:ATP/maltotriose-dependent transcriptional regulator MalT
MLGRYEEAVKTIDEGMPMAEQAGLERTVGAFMRGNRAEALMRSGRLQEAMAAVAPGAEAPGVFAGTLLLLRAELHLVSGRRREAELDLRDARRHLRRSSASQFALPLAALEAEFARSGGDLEAARNVLQRALTETGAGGEHRYQWPLFSLAARIEADRALASRDAGRPPPEDADRRMTAVREAAEATATTTPGDRGHLALVRAEHASMIRSGQSEAWSAAVDACREMNEPFVLSYALLRRAEALIAAGDGESAAASAQEALALARPMGSVPLVEEIEALMRRGRLRPAPDASPGRGENGAASDDPASDELERRGLTSREREVLRLVAEGYSNSQIGDRLFISRKTASVHVSNILAKLGVSTRIEAAAIAHRLGD